MLDRLTILQGMAVKSAKFSPQPVFLVFNFVVPFARSRLSGYTIWLVELIIQRIYISYHTNYDLPNGFFWLTYNLFCISSLNVDISLQAKIGLLLSLGLVCRSSGYGGLTFYFCLSLNYLFYAFQ